MEQISIIGCNDGCIQTQVIDLPQSRAEPLWAPPGGQLQWRNNSQLPLSLLCNLEQGKMERSCTSELDTLNVPPFQVLLPPYEEAIAIPPKEPPPQYMEAWEASLQDPSPQPSPHITLLSLPGQEHDGGWTPLVVLTDLPSSSSPLWSKVGFKAPPTPRTPTLPLSRCCSPESTKLLHTSNTPPWLHLHFSTSTNTASNC